MEIKLNKMSSWWPTKLTSPLQPLSSTLWHFSSSLHPFLLLPSTLSQASPLPPSSHRHSQSPTHSPTSSYNNDYTYDCSAKHCHDNIATPPTILSIVEFHPLCVKNPPTEGCFPNILLPSVYVGNNVVSPSTRYSLLDVECKISDYSLCIIYDIFLLLDASILKKIQKKKKRIEICMLKKINHECFSSNWIGMIRNMESNLVSFSN